MTRECQLSESGGPAPGAVYYHSFPMFHVAGLAYNVAPFLYDTLAVLAHGHGPPNGQTVIEVMKQLMMRIIPMPPFLWDDIVTDYPEGFLEKTRDLEYVVYGRGPLTKPTGDFFATNFKVAGFFAIDRGNANSLFDSQTLGLAIY